MYNFKCWHGLFQQSNVALNCKMGRKILRQNAIRLLQLNELQLKYSKSTVCMVLLQVMENEQGQEIYILKCNMAPIIHENTAIFPSSDPCPHLFHFRMSSDFLWQFLDIHIARVGWRIQHQATGPRLVIWRSRGLASWEVERGRFRHLVSRMK